MDAGFVGVPAGFLAADPDFAREDFTAGGLAVGFVGVGISCAIPGMLGIIVESPIAFVISLRNAVSLMTRARIMGSASSRM